MGLPWAAANQHRIARLVITDTGMYRAGGRMSEAWQAFHDHVQTLEAFPVADMVDGACLTDLPAEVRAAYEAPFPPPRPVVTRRAAGAAAAGPHQRGQPRGRRAHACVGGLRGLGDAARAVRVGRQGPHHPGEGRRAHAQLGPGAHAFGTVTASHFLQEDAGAEIGRRIATFIAETT